MGEAHSLTLREAIFRDNSFLFDFVKIGEGKTFEKKMYIYFSWNILKNNNVSVKLFLNHANIRMEINDLQIICASKISFCFGERTFFYFCSFNINLSLSKVWVVTKTPKVIGN